MRPAAVSLVADMDVEKLMIQLEEKEAELIEYQESSRELELELQKQLELSEKRNQELSAVNCRLQRDYEELKSKSVRERQDLVHKVEELSQELLMQQTHNKTLTEGIRNLEQMNDDLERSKRALAATLEDFETKFNSQIEKNVLLENELGEKSELEEVIQRLKDEARELREELLVQQTKRISISESHNSTAIPQQQSHPTPIPNTVLPSNCHSKIHRPINKPNSIPVSRNHFSSPTPPSLNHNNSHQHNHVNNHTMNNSSSSRNNNNNIFNSLTKSPPSSSTPVRSPPSQQQPLPASNSSPVKGSAATTAATNGPISPTGKSVILTNGSSNGQSVVRDPLPLLSPNTRNSALNIVSDLLRKVGDLESKLASCRNIVPQACRNSSEV